MVTVRSPLSIRRESAFSSVVLPEPVPPEIRMLSRARTARSRNSRVCVELGSIDRSKLNVNGSSLAAGHPFAATGGRILAQAAKQLAEKKAEQTGGRSAKPLRALISICAAGGQGVAKGVRKRRQRRDDEGIETDLAEFGFSLLRAADAAMAGPLLRRNLTAQEVMNEASKSTSRRAACSDRSGA